MHVLAWGVLGEGGAVYPQAWSWVPWSLSSPMGSVFFLPPRPPQMPGSRLTRVTGDGPARRTGRPRQRTALLTQVEPQ